MGGTITTADGLVNCGAAGNVCGDAEGWIQIPLAQASLTLTATPTAGWTFIQWAGDCTGTNPSLYIQLAGPRTCGAVFNPIGGGSH